MSEHLTATMLCALADGEVSSEQMAAMKKHLDECPLCTSQALSNALLKTATAKAGQRHSISPQFQQKMKRMIAQEPERISTGGRSAGWNWVGITGWAAAVVLLVVFGAPVYVENALSRIGAAPRERALISEVSDLHVAALAANQPEVLSSDRHTVKPWFQGKLPFSFNLPDNLPAGTQLDGADLVYLHGQPVAQLLYHVGQHRASVFIRQRSGDESWSTLPQEHAGFQFAGFHTPELDVLAVSDVERARLMALVGVVEQAQVGAASGGTHP